MRATQWVNNPGSLRYWSILVNTFMKTSCAASSSSLRLGRWERTMRMTCGYKASTSRRAAGSSPCLTNKISWSQVDSAVSTIRFYDRDGGGQGWVTKELENFHRASTGDCIRAAV